MLTINLVFILRKSVNSSVNLFSNRNMNSAIVFQRKEEDRRQAELSGCAVDTRLRPSSPPLRTPEQQAPKVNRFSWYF